MLSGHIANRETHAVSGVWLFVDGTLNALPPCISKTPAVAA